MPAFFIFGVMMTDTVSRVQQLLEPILGTYGLSLWETEFKKEGPTWRLRIFIDREPGGVTLDDCEAVSRDLSAILDVEDIILHAYSLEVSSPGLDRKLTRPEHFTRMKGSMVKIKTYQPIDGQKVFRGRLLGTVEDRATIELESGGTMEIPMTDMAKASLEVEF